MHPRFSLRLLFVAVTLLAFAIFWYVRPAILADQFATALTKGDYTTAESLLHGDFWLFSASPDDPNRSIDLVYAEVLPREWLDIWNRRCRVLVRVGSHHVADGGRIDWTEDTEFIARPDGVRLDLGEYRLKLPPN